VRLLGLTFGIGQHHPCPLLSVHSTLGEELGRQPFGVGSRILQQSVSLFPRRSLDLGSLGPRGGDEQLAPALELVQRPEKKRDLTGQLIPSGWHRRDTRRRAGREPDATEPLE
jgi:hypothetical protein